SGIGYHGRPQLEIAADLLAGQCDRVYISIAAEPRKGFDGCATRPDRFIGFGPSGGILTALHERPDAAWMVLGCDLPLMTADDLRQLADGRDVLRPATAFSSPSGDLPEPLVAIYEPRMLSLFHEALAMDISCPRKVLIRSRARLVTPRHREAVMNANTPADRDRVSAIIRGQREE
ncbi:MAG: NTP transferase domain-containing protein, partial [Spirochaetia bacterium]